MKGAAQWNCSTLNWKRFVVSNYRSIRRIELDHLDNVVWLAGRNNAGKSNLLDAFQFLADAATSFEHALASRGRDLAQSHPPQNARARMDLLFRVHPRGQDKARGIDPTTLCRKSPPARCRAHLLTTDFLYRHAQSAFRGPRVFQRGAYRQQHPLRLTRLIFSVKGTPKKTEVVTLRTARSLLQKNARREIPPVGRGLSRTCRLEPTQPVLVSAWGRPESGAIAAGFQRIGRRRAPSIRLPASGPSSPDDAEAHRGRPPARPGRRKEANLPEVLYWVYNNKPSQFRRIEAQVQKLVPRLAACTRPRCRRSRRSPAVIDPRDEDLIYSMTEMSSGTRAVVALVTKVMLAPPGAWLCLEAPEYCLHPQAQMRLIQFLRAERVGKRIFGATHFALHRRRLSHALALSDAARSRKLHRRRCRDADQRRACD